MRDLAEAIARPPWLLDSARVWEAYRRLNGVDRVRDPSPVRLLTDLVALVRYALGQTTVLEPLAREVERRFNLWLGREKNAGRDYSEEQAFWLRLLRDAVAANAEVLPADLREQPQFQARGGMARARRLFGADRVANCCFHRVEYQFGPQMVGHRPTDDLAAPRVQHHGEIQEPARCRHIGDVGDPELVRPDAVNLRSTRSGAGRASWSRRVVTGPPCRWLAPIRPACFISV